ncbi:MAG TPA: hypothetical protein VJH34_03255 [archaeon]|nr:hypothetical protein [archaeon]
MAENDRVEIGKVSHYYGKLGVAVVELTHDLKAGDEIIIEGHGVSFKQKVASMQIEHEKVQHATKGQSIGLRVEGTAKDGCKVYKIVG